MEPILGLALVAGAAYGAYRASRSALTAHPVIRRTPPDAGTAARTRQLAVETQRRVAQAKHHRAVNDLYRTLQVALLQLDRAPDFRRSASIAVKAAIIPAAYRQRLFVRFRPSLVAHFARCLANGSAQAELTDSLTRLLIGLGIASFEAGYIRSEASARIVQPSTPTPTDRVETLRQDHETRVAAIRQGVGQSPELLEQLLEAEEMRYRQALLNVFDDAPSRGSELPHS